jgi:hypothetical protein
MGDTTFDIFGPQQDPFRELNPFKRSDPLGGAGYSRRQAAKYPPLPDDQADPLKQGLLDRTVSGLHFVGSTLDKTFGGRAVRGVLGGKPQEALSIIPFSDTLGLTDPKNVVSGSDLLKRVGVDTTKGNWLKRNILPVAVEIGLDPGSYINPFGAATKAGKLATGLGHTEGWSRRALTQGFTHLEPELRAAGRTAEEIAHMANQGARIAPQSLLDDAATRGLSIEAGTPLRGALGLGMPFRPTKGAIGTGRLAEGLAGFQDDAIRSIKSAPGIRQARAWFDPRVMRSAHAGVAEAAETAGRPAREAAESTTRAAEYELRTQLDEMLRNYAAVPGAENEALRIIRAGAEDASPHYTDPTLWSRDLDRRYSTVLPSGNRLATGVQDVNAVRNHLMTNWTTLQDMAARVRAFGRSTLEGAEDLGLNAANLADDYAHYAYRRYIDAAPGFGGTQQGRQFPTMHGSNMARRSPLRNIPGGSEQINEWAIHPELSGASRTLPPDQVAGRVYADMERHIQSMFPPPAMRTPEQAAAVAAELASAQGKSREVAHWLGSVPDVHAAQGVPYFNPDVIGDLATRGQRHARVVGSAEALIRGATQMARPVSEFGVERHVRLGDFLNHNGQAGLRSTVRQVRLTDAEQAALAGAGFRDADHLRTVASNPAIASPVEQAALSRVSPALAAKVQQDEWSGAAIRAYEQMAPRGFGPVADAIGMRVNPIAALNQYGLAEHDAAAMARFLQGWVAPTEAQPFLRFMQGAQDVFKNAVYPMWPASHFRNATSALWNNFIHGTSLDDYADAARIMREGRIADPARYGRLTAGMTPEQAAHALNRQAYADAKVYTGVNSFTENVGGRGLADERLAAGLRGEKRLVPRAPGSPSEQGLRDVLTAPGAWNPLGQAGIGGRHADTFAPLVLGRRAGTAIEDYVRMAHYLGNLRQGMASSKAGQLTRAVHFDYQDLTQAEQNVMKSVIPFYTFMRKNLPYQVKMALAEPNKVLPLLHGMGATDPNAEWTPEYLASGASIPLGPESADGSRRYLAKFGLPIEEMAERFKFKNYELPGGHKVNLPSLGGTAMAFLGSTNPMLKGPLEYMTDTQFHSGRRLSDLHSKGIAGGFGLVDEPVAQAMTQLVANSPLARFASTANTLADDRKGPGAKALNLLTGVRITDVDLQKQRAVAARKNLEELLRTDPSIAEFVNYYARPGAEITPDVAEKLRLFSTLKRDAKDFHAEKANREKLRELYGPLRSGL